MEDNESIKKEILSLVEKYCNQAFKREFVPGKTTIQNSEKLFNSREMMLCVESALDGWWTEGRFSNEFSRKIGEVLGVKHVALTNSGSSANLVAISSLFSAKLGERRIKPGDEIITVASGFPTTINPIIQNGGVPVFVDVSIGNYNAIPEEIEKAVTKKTKAIALAHTLGNPFNLKKIKEVCEKHSLWLVEDCCDAFGSKYDGKNVGTFGDIATLSFYPAHHITTGEGGAVFTNNAELAKIAFSIRDWGRDCSCPPGKDNTCGKRFCQQHGELPSEYDHKYVYSNLGYNLKMTDMQAAIGLAQLEKLQSFIKARKENFDRFDRFMQKYQSHFHLPKAEENSEPSWFGYLMTVKEDAPFSRNEIVEFLNKNKVSTRLLFGGNILKQPYFVEGKFNYRISGKLNNSDAVMERSFWIGIQPSITCEMQDYMMEIFDKFESEMEKIK